VATDSYGNADDGVKDGTARSALVVAVLLALAGCTLIGGKPEHPAVTYDLRRPPTRTDVGIPDGEKVVVDEANEGYPVTLLLPEGRRLKTKVNLVTFDSFGAGTDATHADPTGADLHTARVSLDDAAAVMAASLRQLGSSGAAADQWVERARSATGTATVRSENIPTRLGYLAVRLQGRYSPLDERASVAYTLDFAADG
jgi:hypothetical protein